MRGIYPGMTLLEPLGPVTVTDEEAPPVDPPGEAPKVLPKATSMVMPLGNLYCCVPEAPADPEIPPRPAVKACVPVCVAEAPQFEPPGPATLKPCACAEPAAALLLGKPTPPPLQWKIYNCAENTKRKNN